MLFLALDIGTTHCKAGLFDRDGHPLRIATEAVAAQRYPQGYSGYDPAELWASVQRLAAAVCQQGAPQAIGIASMAETGLLLDRRSGQVRSPLLPWFDPIATPQAERLRQMLRDEGGFAERGLRPSFKAAVMKLLWLQENQPDLLPGAVWLSSADYIAWRLTGQFATDRSLAGRTYALHLPSAEWDLPWLARLGLPPDVFPPIVPAGEVMGHTLAGALPGLPEGVPVTIAGHDHVCGALAAHGFARQTDESLGGDAHQTLPASGGVQGVFDSLGTAESLLGAFPARPLTPDDDASGFAFGWHVLAGQMYWMGGLSAAGGSLDWLRRLLSNPPLDYAALERLLAELAPAPTGILYYPYLSGAGSPHSDPAARGVLHGLSLAHGRSHLARAILEGLCCEVEWMRRRADAVTGLRLAPWMAAGGGTRSPAWMQLKADLSGVPVLCLPQSETTLLGAAMLAAHAAGSPITLAAGVGHSYLPDPQRYADYQQQFERWQAGLV